jgi:sterol 3beta-glucosyltransferase
MRRSSISVRITIIAMGSRGDVQPYIALGKGLHNAGHLVRFVTHENFDSLVRSHKLEFWPVEGNVQDIAQNEEMQAQIEKGNFLTLMKQMAKEAQRGALNLAKSGFAACQETDLVLGGLGGVYIGLALAEKLNLPFLQAYYVPFTPTKAFPGVLTPKLPSIFGNSLNRLSHALARQIIWQGFRSADKVARQAVLNVPAAPFWGPYHSQPTQGLPILYGIIRLPDTGS